MSGLTNHFDKIHEPNADKLPFLQVNAHWRNAGKTVFATIGKGILKFRAFLRRVSMIYHAFVDLYVM